MSGSGIWSVQKAVYGRLSGDATLTALITGVFDTAPNSQAFPYIEIGSFTEIPFRVFGKNGHEDTVTLHIWTRDEASGATGFKPGLTILDRVTTLLEGTPLVIENHATVLCNAEFTDTLKEGDGITRQIIARYRVVAQDS